MLKSKWKFWIISISIIIAVVFIIFFSGEKSVVNSYGYALTKKDSKEVLSDINSFYDAISKHNVQEMAKYTIENEPDGRIDFLDNFFENDFNLTINNLEIVYNYPKFPKGDFDNEKFDNQYDVEKAVILKAEFAIESNEIDSLLGLDIGYHKLYLYVAKTKLTDYWQIVDMSTIDPLKEKN